VLARRGVDGFVFRGDDGLDELTTTTSSHVWAIVGGEVTESTLDARDLGLSRSQPADLTGGDAAYNSGVVMEVLEGGRGSVRDTVLLNAAAGIAAYDGQPGEVAERLESALVRATEAVDSGAARAKLAEWVAAVEGL